MRMLIERYPLISYFFLCFIISWSIWIPAGLLAPNMTLMLLPGAWSPTIAALLITLITEGRTGVRVLLRGVLKWRVGAGFYAFAIFGMLGVALLSVGLNVLLGGSSFEIESIAIRYGIPAEQAHMFIAFAPIIFIVSIFVGGPIAEELGWRGFAQPRMQAKVGAGRAGLAIGFDDESYVSVGAEIVSTPQEIFQRADLIVKVKEPQAVEAPTLIDLSQMISPRMRNRQSSLGSSPVICCVISAFSGR